MSIEGFGRSPAAPVS